MLRIKSKVCVTAYWPHDTAPDFSPCLSPSTTLSTTQSLASLLFPEHITHSCVSGLLYSLFHLLEGSSWSFLNALLHPFILKTFSQNISYKKPLTLLYCSLKHSLTHYIFVYFLDPSLEYAFNKGRYFILFTDVSPQPIPVPT